LNKLLELELIERYPNVKKHNPHVLYTIRHCRLKSIMIKSIMIKSIMIKSIMLKSTMMMLKSMILKSMSNKESNRTEISNKEISNKEKSTELSTIAGISSLKYNFRLGFCSKYNFRHLKYIRKIQKYNFRTSYNFRNIPDNLLEEIGLDYIYPKFGYIYPKFGYFITEPSTTTGISHLKSMILKSLASVLNMSLTLNIYPTNASKPTIFKEFNAKELKKFNLKPMTPIVKSVLYTKSTIISTSDTSRIFFDFQYIQDLKPSVKNNFEVINGVKTNQNGVKPQKSDQYLSLIKNRREQNKKEMNNHKYLKTFKSLIPLKILLELAEKPQTVSELSKKLNVSKRTIRYHISNLQKIAEKNYNKLEVLEKQTKNQIIPKELFTTKNYFPYIIRCGGTRCKYAYLMLSPVKIEHRHKFTKYHRRYHKIKRIKVFNTKTNRYKTFSLKTIRKLFSSASYEIAKKPVKCCLYSSGSCGNTSLFKINLPDHHTYLCHEHFKLLRNESLTL